MHSDPSEDPKAADHHARQPYEQSGLSKVFGLIVVLILFGLFFGWLFLGQSDGEIEQKEPPVEEVANEEFAPPPSSQETNDDHEEGTEDRDSVYGLFNEMFGGIEGGLENSPHNLENVDYFDKLNIDRQKLMGDSSPNEGRASSQSRDATQSSQQKSVYRHSAMSVMGSEVYDYEGRKTGNIQDILINKETGKARVVIMDEEGKSRYERRLAALHFEDVLKQEADGDVMVTQSKEIIEDAPDFDYSSIKDTNYVSLKALSDGQLLDFEGKVAGQIDAVIYENAEIQNIYFTLRPVLVQGQEERKFYLPFEEITIVENTDGYDIQLSKAQTEALAEQLFEKGE